LKFNELQAEGGRRLLLRPGSAPTVYLESGTKSLNLPAFSVANVEAFVSELLDPEQVKEFHARASFQTRYEGAGGPATVQFKKTPEGPMIVFDPEANESSLVTGTNPATPPSPPPAPIAVPTPPSPLPAVGGIPLPGSLVGPPPMPGSTPPSSSHPGMQPPGPPPIPGAVPPSSSQPGIQPPGPPPMAGAGPAPSSQPDAPPPGPPPIPATPAPPPVALPQVPVPQVEIPLGPALQPPKVEIPQPVAMIPPKVEIPPDAPVTPADPPRAVAPAKPAPAPGRLDAPSAAPPRRRGPTMSMEFVRDKVRSNRVGMGARALGDLETFNELLRGMVMVDASDMHVAPGNPPMARVYGSMRPMDGHGPVTADASRSYAMAIMTPQERKRLETNKAVDLAYSHPDIGRFRCNIFYQHRGVAIAARHIKETVGSFEQLGLPEAYSDIANLKMGLVLFTGPTGSGKSTSLAAIIEYINQNRTEHIITLEQPIEFVFENSQCLIQQREVGKHTPTFSRGFEDALREDPDIILCGELRDRDTAMMAIQGATSGHLVFGTLHTNTCASAVSRIIDMFAEDQKHSLRITLTEVLEAVVNQRLIPTADGGGRVLASEFMRVTPAVATQIRDNKVHQIATVLGTSRDEGMWSFERSLVNLYRQGKISKEQADAYAPDKRLFSQLLASKGTLRGAPNS
jgi:twitching motility protein PilT